MMGLVVVSELSLTESSRSFGGSSPASPSVLRFVSVFVCRGPRAEGRGGPRRGVTASIIRSAQEASVC